MCAKRLFQRMIGALLFGLFLVACGSGQATLTPTQTPTADSPMPAETPVPASTTGQLIFTDIPALSLEDNLLGDSAEKSVVIYLPPSYEISDKRYPVVFFLPGYSTDNRAFTDGTFQGFRLQESMDQLIADGSIKEMIIVIPKGQHSLGGSFYVNSPVTGNWEDFIVEDVVNYVDTQYRTIPATESRGIAGHSMGGYGALNLAMLHPDLLGAVYSLSPGLFDPEGLSNSQMFHTQRIIDQFLGLERDLTALSREEAHSALFAKGISGDLPKFHHRERTRHPPYDMDSRYRAHFYRD
jgi:S-formylglutathione hydrolase FrmB